METFNLRNKENFNSDLVARVLHAGDVGGVPHDTDVTYLVRQPDAPFFGRDSITERELKDFLEKEGEEHGTTVFFIRWEEPGEWSML